VGLFVAGLTAKTGATVLPFPGQPALSLGVEWRVGRGRVLVLSFRPTDAALATWPGLDTLVRTVVFRRPQDAAREFVRPVLSSREVSWLRIAARDLGAPAIPAERDDAVLGNSELPLPREDVAAWLDEAALPATSRGLLQTASGIRVPGRSFVLRVVLAYAALLIPLNWLACRFLARRREVSWIVAPLLALGVAGAIERLAAQEAGVSFACDEVDIVELHGGYPRAHLSRFVSLYATGRVPLRVDFPAATGALALPMSLGSAQYRRGEDIARSSWNTYPATAIENLTIQPRSLAMYRAEQFIDLGGSIRLERLPDGTRRLVNDTGLALRDALVITLQTRTVQRLGELAPGASRDLAAIPSSVLAEKEPIRLSPTYAPWLDPEPLLRSLAEARLGGPEEAGEVRLLAWAEEPMPEQKLAPVPDRHRGLRLVIAHLEQAPPPSPLGPPYLINGGVIPTAVLPAEATP
jgi:hypothetical protein